METTNDMDTVIRKLTQLTIIFLLSGFLWGCGSDNGQNTNEQTSFQTQTESDASETTVDALANPLDNKGVGPVDHVELGPVDEAMAAEGKAIFEANCTACHQLEERYIGPAMKEVTARRSPEWIMNMIMNPNEMVEKDPIAKALLAEYLSPMANQNISQEQARKILEYFRSIDEVK